MNIFIDVYCCVLVSYEIRCCYLHLIHIYWENAKIFSPFGFVYIDILKFLFKISVFFLLLLLSSNSMHLLLLSLVFFALLEISFIVYEVCGKEFGVKQEKDAQRIKKKNNNNIFNVACIHLKTAQMQNDFFFFSYHSRLVSWNTFLLSSC